MNFTENSVRFLGELEASGIDLFYHSLSLLDSPNYRYENKRGLHHDWPRIPLPSSKELLLQSAELGRSLVAMFDTEHGVRGVTEATIDKPLDTIGIISRVGGGQLQTSEDESQGRPSELRVTAGWGHGGKGGITMPGKGKVIERDYTTEERASIEQGAARLDVSVEELLAHLGETTCDVYLNDMAFFLS